MKQRSYKTLVFLFIKHHRVEGEQSSRWMTIPASHIQNLAFQWHFKLKTSMRAASSGPVKDAKSSAPKVQKYLPNVCGDNAIKIVLSICIYFESG